MALPTVIAKNQTLSDIFLPKVGLSVLASGQTTLTEFVSFFEASLDPILVSTVTSGDIIVNDGNSDLSAAEALAYLDATGNMNGPVSGSLVNTLVKLEDATGRYTASTGVTVDASDNIATTGTINASGIEISGSALTIDDLGDVDTTTQAPTNEDSFRWDGSNWVPKKNTHSASPPATSDDSTQGYVAGSEWLDTNTGYVYTCVDNSVATAVWIPVPQVINDLTDVNTISQPPTDNDGFTWNGSAWIPLKTTHTTVDPTVNDDSSANYQEGSRWLNVTTGQEYVCLDDSVGAAIWTLTTATTPLGGIWQFDSTTTASDPGAGNFRLNNATQASATALYINEISQGTADFSDIIGSLRAGDRLYLQQSDVPPSFHMIRVTGAPTDNGSWQTIPIVVEDSGASLANGWGIGFLFFWTSAATLEGQLQVTVNDTTPGYLDDKLTTSTTGVDFTVVNPSGDEDLRLDIDSASATGQGLIELATQGEVDTGTDTTRAVTPDTLNSATTVIHPSDSVGDLADVDTTTQTPTAEDGFRWDGSDWVPKKNTHTTTDPTVNDDSGDDYVVGSEWINTTDDSSFICLDNSSGAAVWVRTDAEGATPYSDEVTSDTSTTTSATSAVLLNSMTITPDAGTYLVWFSADVSSSKNNTKAAVVLYSGGTEVTDSERTFVFNSSNGDAVLSTQAKITVTGSQAIEGRWYVVSGSNPTLTAVGRSLMIERVS